MAKDDQREPILQMRKVAEGQWITLLWLPGGVLSGALVCDVSHQTAEIDPSGEGCACDRRSLKLLLRTPV